MPPPISSINTSRPRARACRPKSVTVSRSAPSIRAASVVVANSTGISWHTGFGRRRAAISRRWSFEYLAAKGFSRFLGFSRFFGFWFYGFEESREVDRLGSSRLLVLRRQHYP